MTFQEFCLANGYDAKRADALAEYMRYLSEDETP